MAKFFGTDGVRGEANKTLTPELAYQVGRAATIYFRKKNDAAPKFLIGRDTRLSGTMFETALAAGICSAGGHAVLVGIIPTPAIAYLTKKFHFQAGIVVSASHNPFFDNGIKFFGADGYKLSDEIEEDIEKIILSLQEKDTFERALGGEVGTVEHQNHLADFYTEYVLSTVNNLNLSNKKIVLDCANGAAYDIMPKILKQLGANLIVIHSEPNGTNINDQCGSTHLENLQRRVLQEKADVGIAHDGDADRCLLVDDQGEIIDGDFILTICALDRKAQGTLNKNTVVSTVMANLGFRKAMHDNGIHIETTKVGDRYVLENMLANQYSLGGEQSGHIIFPDFATTGDGLITALQMMTVIQRSEKKLSELAASMKKYPQLLINVAIQRDAKETWQNNEKIQDAIANGEQLMGDAGRLLIRPSGTEALLRVMGECEDEALLHKICQDIAQVVQNEIGL